jgi:serine protease
MLEIEPNHTLDQAQAVMAQFRVSGSAALADPGFRDVPGQPQIKVEDLYRLSADGPVRIILTIAEDDLINNDLDLFLLDDDGNVINSSLGLLTTEVLEASAGDFLIGIRVFQGASAYVLSLDTVGSLSNADTAIVPPEAAFVPGDVLVKFNTGKVALQPQASQLATAYGLMHVASLPPDVELMRASLPSQRSQQGGSEAKLLLPQSENNALIALTLDTIRRLHQDPDVAYAEPNFLRQAAARVPNDTLFERQWHYELINLPAAWDITIGSDDVIVAVIDSGILPGHPDLSPRLIPDIPGFDFVSMAEMEGDDDVGPDPDATDPGDDPRNQNSSFHGTHVAGIIGAATDNMRGVAGVTWQTRIMPLRALGLQGIGTDADIAQAIRFAAGLSNSSGTFPAAPANIINMSLSGPGSSNTLQQAILAARAQGVIVVAAAGNENSPVFQSPASLPGVISVAAVDRIGEKAPYSNFGSGIDVAAPGGDLSANLDGDGFPDGVLSTLGNDRGDFLYRFYQGTSMASPHVAGVLALMLAVNPDLTPMDIDDLLAGTHPETMLRITRELGAPGRDDFYGHGLIDAAAAVIAADAIVGGTVTPAGSTLTVSTTTLAFKNFISTLTFEVSNGGSGTLMITNITDDAPWLTLSPTSGTAPLTVTASVDRTGLADGVQTATIQITSDATQGEPMATLNVLIEVGGNTRGNVGTVFILVLNPDTTATVAQAVTSSDQEYAFTLPSVPPGAYVVVAGTDRDDDNLICDIEDACGFSPRLVTIVEGQNTPIADFIVSDLVSLQSLPAALDIRRMTPFVRLY